MNNRLRTIIEKGDNEWWGWIKGVESFLPTSVANTVPELVVNIKELLQDWQVHEGIEIRCGIRSILMMRNLRQ